ncbi:MAG TPA: Na/Pi cotransporter family protein, partial [Rhodopila sp.]|nr:Na/Pi cotransporter family protein [Rhodopila sp.]
MDFSITLVNLAGSVALLLWGVHMVQTGVQRALGARLRGLLGVALRNRMQAFLAGIGVTALLQSSTATGLMVTGFAAGGLVDLVPALAVMLGANVGSTLIVQALSFHVAEVAPALILIGVLMFRRTSAAPRDFGRVLIGLGLVLMALSQFVALLDPYEDVPSLRMMLGAVATQPVLDVILAAGLTWAAHSSVAVVLLIMSFATKGVVPPHAAFALVLGANLGTAINPVLEGGAGDDPAARRLPIGNLINRGLGVVVALALLPVLGPWLVTIDPDNTRVVADFHTGFNLILALVFFPLLTPYAALLRRLMPTRIDTADPSRPMYLDEAAIEVPMVALGAATREALRMADALAIVAAERFRRAGQHGLQRVGHAQCLARRRCQGDRRGFQCG